MKHLYFIRHGKSNWSDTTLLDAERKLEAKGLYDIQSVGLELKHKGIIPDIVLTSCAIRAQDSTLELVKILGYQGKIHYMKELYLESRQRLQEIITFQPNECEHLFIIGHDAQLTSFINTVINEHITKLPTSNVIALTLNINKWSELEYALGKIAFFIQTNELEAKAS